MADYLTNLLKEKHMKEEITTDKVMEAIDRLENLPVGGRKIDHTQMIDCEVGDLWFGFYTQHMWTPNYYKNSIIDVAGDLIEKTNDLDLENLENLDEDEIMYLYCVINLSKKLNYQMYLY